jgi:hypothetical protein
MVGRPGNRRKLALEPRGDYGTLLRVDALDAARHVVAERFPDALAAMLAGSAGTALRTATSDLDILVFLGGPPARFRETTRYAGWIVELFVHTPISYPRFIERETNERRSPLLHMCGEGRLLIDTDAFGATIRDEARHLIEAGPTPLTDQKREDRRYALTDQLDDLVGCKDEDELAITGCSPLSPSWRYSNDVGGSVTVSGYCDGSGAPIPTSLANSSTHTAPLSFITTCGRWSRSRDESSTSRAVR